MAGTGDFRARIESMSLDAAQFDRLFPFHIVVDRAMTIVQVGSSISRIWPDVCPGVALSECMMLSSPRVPFSFDALVDHQGSLVILKTFSGAQLRGQVLTIDRHRLVFVGSPFVASPAQLERMGLHLNDFALHDSVADYMFLLQAQSTALDNTRGHAASLGMIGGETAGSALPEQALPHELHALPDLVVKVDRAGTLLELRPATETDLRAPLRELVGRSVYDAFPEMAERLRDGLRSAFALQEVQSFEYSAKVRSGEAFYEARVVRCSDQEALVLVRDVSARHELQRQLLDQAFHDSLTGLANRSLFEDHVSRALGRTNGEDWERDGLAVLFIDIDDLHAVNDALGHRVGDSLLVAVAERLKEVTRPGDVVARLGGDEFAVLVEGAKQDIAETLAHRLIEAFGRPFDAGSEQIAITASIGVATRLGDVSAEDLLRNADMAMYAAKTAGKGRPALFEPSMQDGLLTQLVMESELREAVNEGQFTVLYQPVVDIRSGAVVGTEALVRWQHPSRGLLLPADFIPLAEKSGMIVPIGSMVLKEACAQAATWDPSVTVSVNVSTRQLVEPGLVETVAQVLEGAPLDPHRLVLEIAETSLTEEAELAARVLADLKELGVHLALDDFGTGFSSLGHLLKFPIGMIKVDKSFVGDITGDGNASALVGAILGVGGILGINVVAEGVESEEQLHLLRRWHCASGQGYLFAPPLGPSEIKAFLDGRTPWPEMLAPHDAPPPGRAM